MKFRVSRVCMATAAYQLLWALPLLIMGASMLEPELGTVFAPEVLGDNPVLNAWVRLVGTVLVSLSLLAACLSRVTDPGAQSWIRRGYIAYWGVELFLSTCALQLPALLADEPHMTLSAFAFAAVARTGFFVAWLMSAPDQDLASP